MRTLFDNKNTVYLVGRVGCSVVKLIKQNTLNQVISLYVNLPNFLKEGFSSLGLMFKNDGFGNKQTGL
jgi:hypothetical protein